MKSPRRRTYSPYPSNGWKNIVSASPTISTPLKFWVVGDVLEQGQSAGSVDRKLDRPNAGQRLEPVEVGVEQDARIADDRDRGASRADALLDPGDFAIVEIAGVEPDRGAH